MKTQTKNNKIHIALPVMLFILLIVCLVGIERIFNYAMQNQTRQVAYNQLETVSADLREELHQAEVSCWKVAEGCERLLYQFASDEVLMQYFLRCNEELADENCFNTYLGSDDKYVIPGISPEDDYQCADRLWYKGAKRSGRGQAYISPPYIDAVSGNFCFTVSMKLREKDMVVGLDFYLTNVQKRLEELSRTLGGDTILVSDSGEVVAYSDVSLVGSKVADSLPQYSATIQKILSSGEDSMSFVNTISGSPVLVMFRRTSSSWYLVSFASDRIINRALYIHLFVALGAAFVLIFALTVLVIRQSTVRQKLANNTVSERLQMYEQIQEIRSMEQNLMFSCDHEKMSRYQDQKAYMNSMQNQIAKLGMLTDELLGHASSAVPKAKPEPKKTGKSRETQNRRILVGVMVVLCIAMVISLVLSTTVLTRSANEKMKAETGGYSNELKVWIAEQKSILDMYVSYISADPRILEDYEGCVRWLADVTKDYDSISVSYMTNPEAEHTVIMNNGWQPEPGWKVEDRQWFMDSMASEAADGFNISSPYYDEQTGLYCVTMSERVYNGSGDFIGIFGIDFYLDKLTEILSESYTDQSYAFLVDCDGNIINHPDKEYELNNNGGYSAEKAGYLEILYSDHPVSFTDYDGTYAVAMSTLEENSQFFIVLVKNWNQAYGAVISYNLLFVIIFGICMLGILYFLRSLMRWQEETNDKLQESAEQAKKADEAKSQFLTQMSHEIRTPINAVLGMDEMILRETNSEAVKGYAKDIQNAGNSLLVLINDILDLSKIESGKITLIPEIYELSDVLTGVVQMIRFRAEAKNIQFITEIDADIPGMLCGDDVRIKQVITNLLTNAVKYTPAGCVWFRVKGKRDGDYEDLYIEVEDTGIGIRDEDIPRIFRNFERIDDEQTHHIEGTGLGISITQKLLGLMHSKLEVESSYGHGSKFYFTIRQQIIDSTPVGNVEELLKEKAEGTNARELFYAPSAKILLVDDNDLNRRVLCGLLKDTGVQVTEASSGAECLKIAEKTHFHMIFMDHMMPEMDGIETFRRLKRECDINATTPVYILTANAIAGAKEQYLEEGFNGYLTKPVDAEKIEKAIFENLPKELLETPPKGRKLHQQTDEGFNLDDYPVIGGIDWKYAWAHLSDEELIRETVLNFLFSVPKHIKELEDSSSALRGSTTAGDDGAKDTVLDTYRILVHSIKSEAATLGIIPLAGLANILEYAARDNDIPTIEQLEPTLEKLLAEYAAQLKEAFAKDEKESKKQVDDVDAIKAKLEMIKVAMVDLDVDKADPIMEELLQYTYAQDVQEKMEELRAAVASLDGDLAESLVSDIFHML